MWKYETVGFFIVYFVPVEHHCRGFPAASSVSVHPGCSPWAAGGHGLQAPSTGLPQWQVFPLNWQLVPTGWWREEEECGDSCHHGKDRWVTSRFGIAVMFLNLKIFWPNSQNKTKTCLCFQSEGMSQHVLRTPVNITLRRFARGSDAVSASWNLSLVGGHGGWQSDGCHILGHHDNFTTISCNSLGNYGLLMVGWVIPHVQCVICIMNLNDGALHLAPLCVIILGLRHVATCRNNIT